VPYVDEGAAQPPALRPSGSLWDLDAGFHVLTVQPVKKGIATLSVVPRALPGAPVAPPLRAAIQFPSVPLDRDRGYTVYLNRQPGVRAGLIVRPLPLDLERPLAVTQQPGEVVSVPIDVPEAGVVRAEAEDGTLLDISVDGAAAAQAPPVSAGRHTLQVIHQGKQTVQYSLGVLPTRLQAGTALPALPAGTEPAAFPVLTAAAPQVLDLGERDSVTYVVKADRPGLYQLESTGLLATQGNLRSRTITTLFEDEQSGPGRNFQVRAYLREGDYQLTLATRGKSAGHLGLTLTESPLIQGGFLTNRIPARATLRAGEAVSYSFIITKPGEFRVRALGQGRRFKCRLEDEDGWPLVPPGGDADVTREFGPGRYRIVILPEPTDAQVLTVIEPGTSARLYTGHGPHKLPLAQSVSGYWTEPEAGAERVPDVWEWNVPAAIDARVELGAGMTAELARIGPGAPQTLAQVTEKGLRTQLEAGRHALRVTSARVDNRVWYRIGVWPDQLVPGSEREVKAPGDVEIAIGETSLVAIASFGDADVKASLFDADGRRLATSDDRSDDWNFDLSASLAAGRYRLRVEPVGAKAATTTVSVRVPREEAHPPLSLPAALDLNPGRSAHVYPLGAVAGELLLVSARSAESIGLALESDEGDGWQPRGAATGRTPRLEVSVTPGTPQRLRVWSLDRRDSPVHVTIATLSPRARNEKALRSGTPLGPVPGTAVGVARFDLERPGLLRVGNAPLAPPLLRFCVDSRPCAEAPDGIVSAPGKLLFVVGDTGASVRAERLVLGAQGTLGTALRRDDRLTADLAATPGPVVVRASSLTLQPGLRVGDSGPMAVGVGSAVAAGFGARQASIWSASREDGEVHVDVTPFPAIKREAEAPQQLALEGTQGRAFALPAGVKRVHLALGTAMLAVLSNGTQVTSVHAPDAGNTAETLETSADTLTLLHIGPGGGQASIGVIPTGALTARVALQVPFEAALVSAGTLRLEVAADGPATLHLRGAVGDATLVRADGQVQRGRDFALTGPGTLQAPHGPGMLLAWLEKPGEDGLALAVPPASAAQTVPAVVPLDGTVRGFRFARREPGLLHLRTATPVLSVVRRPGLAPETEIHPRGALLDAYLPVGESEVVLRALAGQSLVGSLEITATPVTQTGDGLGPEVLLEPGGARLFSFEVKQEGPVGVGVRAGADVVEATLFDSLARPLAHGVVSMPTLKPGTYLLALRAPADGKPVTARPALAGLAPPPTTPPAEVVERYRSPEDAAPAFSSRHAAEQPRQPQGETEEESEGSDEPPQAADEEPGGDL